MDFRYQEYYKIPLQGKVCITAPFTDYYTKKKIIVISVPIYDEGKIIGVLCGVNPAGSFTHALEKSYAQSDADFRLVDQKGNLLLKDSLSSSSSTSNIFSTSYEYTQDLEKAKSNFQEKKAGTAVFKEKDQPEKYMAYVPLKTNDWFIMTTVPSAIVRGPMERMLSFVGILMLALFLTIALMLYTFNRIKCRDREEKYNLAYSDSLTGAKNKTSFILSLQHLSQLYDGQHYVLVLDFKNFSDYNTIFGFKNGDKLILATSDILSQALGQQEFYARSYADKFILLLQACSKEELNRRLEDIFTQIGVYLVHNHQEDYNLLCRFGIYQIQKEDGDKSLHSFIDYANQARVSLLSIHKNTYRYFDDTLHNTETENAKVEARMYKALAAREFELYLQPKFGILTPQPQLNGAESLVRWNFAGEKLLTPNKFIPQFEENGFIIELDMYMLEETCRLLRRWLDEGRKCIPISVNQSRLHIYNADYLANVLSIVDQYEIPHQLLDFEITESAMADSAEQVQEQYKQLRSHGFLTSMDDFGSGYSSLNLLKDLEADTIKIDKEFFNTSFNTTKGQFIVKTLISLVKHLQYHVVAEGVETKEQVDFLLTCQCDTIQGYYFGKPQKVTDFETNYF